MPSESTREMSVLKIHKEDDKSTYVKLRVIDKITFIDASHGNQEWEYKFRNSPGGKRQVWVEDLDGLRVERITGLNMDDLGQEYIFSLLSNPSAHLSTHVTKIYRIDDEDKEDKDTWVKVERIDQLRVIDSTNGQETIYKLNWPDQMVEGWDARAPGGDLCEFPVRLDPFQNIIAAEFASYTMYIEICNVNSITDDNFNLYVNGQQVMLLDFTVDDEQTSYVIKVGDVDKYASPVGVIRGTKEYDSFDKSPFEFGSNELYFEWLQDNESGTYFEISTKVYRSNGQIKYENSQNTSGIESQSSFTRTLDLSSLQSNNSGGA